MWIHVPLPFCPYAPASGDSISDSAWRSQMLAPSVLSRSKPLPAPSWQRAWQKTPWIRRLFGQILEPSMASHGVALWIASLQAIPASPLALQENKREAKTHDISGQMCFAWFERSTHHSVSSKTLADIYDWDLNKSTMTFDQWVTALRQVCSQRRKLVHLISENDYSSWRTVKATESTGGCLSQQRFKERMDAGLPLSLRDQVKHLWPTARVSSANGPSQSEIAAGNPKSRLEVSVINWATPNTMDHLPSRSPEAMRRMMSPGGARAGAKRPSNLREQISWATPNTMDHMPPRSAEAMEKMLGPEGQRAGRSRPSNLREQIVWPTPRAQKTSSENPESWKARRQAGQVSTPPLAMAAVMWPTVTTQDSKNNAGPSQFERNTKPLNVEATLHSSRCHSPLGQKEAGTASQKVLNPQFVEWLMGWPIGWTEFAPVETVSCHWLPLMRGALSWLMRAQQQMENTQNDQYA